MSENLDLVRSIFADWERGDFSSAEWADSEIEFVAADGPSPGRWLGKAGMAAYWRGVLSAFRDFRPEAEAYRELDDERILVPNKWSGQGKTSAFAVESMGAKSAALIHVQDGKVTKFVAYLDREQAFADLGLKE